MGESHPQLDVKPCRLPGIQLPTCGDVARRLMMLRLQKRDEKTLDTNCLSIKNYIAQLADVLRIWKRAPVPTRCRHHVEMARQLWAKGDNICKIGKSRRATLGATAAAAMMPLASSLQLPAMMALMDSSDATIIGAIASAMMPLASSLHQLRHPSGTF